MRGLMIKGAALALAALGWTACSSHDHAGDDGGATGACAAETRADKYVAGLAKKGSVGTLKMRLLEAMPAPPAKGNNAWTVEIADAAGAPVAGATLKVTPYMPDHGHGSSIKAQVTDLGDGRYSVTPLYLFLEGYWTVTFEIAAPGDVSDQVVYAFCLEP